MSATLAPVKQKLRVGDRVIINEPIIFERCGYPMSLEDGLDKVRALVRLEDLGPILTKIGDSLFDNKEYDKLYRELAAIYLKSHRFGGPARTLHTYINEPFRGLECTIERMFTRVTGVRNPGHSPQWWDEDGEPPFLEDPVRHRVLEMWSHSHITYIQIEDVHVTKVEAQS